MKALLTQSEKEKLFEGGGEFGKILLIPEISNVNSREEYR